MTKAAKIARVLAAAAGVAVLGAGSWFGYCWTKELPLKVVSVRGNANATAAELRALAGLDSTRFIFDVDPVVVADRIRRHPWVERASVTRWPTGTLSLRVVERVPVLLALDGTGRARFYLDAEGFPMPSVDGVFYGVPLLKGSVGARHPLRPAADARTLELVRAVAGLEESKLALLSEFELKNRELWLRTVTTDSGQSLQVRMGKDGYAEKLDRLHAFWHQAVLPQESTRFELVDLRFDGQIVTREHLGPGAGAEWN